MATSTYEEVLHEAQALSSEERMRLRAELATLPMTSTLSGAEYVRRLLSRPATDPAAVDEMARVIEEECEQIDPHEW